jgi:hypothetical protein
VRRSVANNLNDNGNNHPGLLLGKSVSLKQMTTRTRHPVRSAVHALVSGAPHRIGHFDVGCVRRRAQKPQARIIEDDHHGAPGATAKGLSWPDGCCPH